MNSNSLISTRTIQELGQAANTLASQGIFEAYRLKRAANTIAAQKQAIDSFTNFLEEVGGTPMLTGNLFDNPQAWQGITWGLIQAYVQWQIQNGYSTATVNQHLAILRKYASLAAQVGCISTDELLRIKAVSTVGTTEARRLDEKRTINGIPTRRGYKKPSFHTLSWQDVEQILTGMDSNSPQGKRDKLMLLLFILLGLRVSELHSLEVSSFNLANKTVSVYRQKVGKTQTHRLPQEVVAALVDYLPFANGQHGLLWRVSKKNGQLGNSKMTIRAINMRVCEWGQLIGIPNLSPHDLRHSWATLVAASGTPINQLMQAGGWASYQMPLRYVKENEIANEGIVLAIACQPQENRL